MRTNCILHLNLLLWIAAASVAEGFSPTSTTAQGVAVGRKEQHTAQPSSEVQRNAGKGVGLFSTVDAVETTKNPTSSSSSKDDTKRRLSLLDEAVRSFNSTSATELLNELKTMRSTGTDESVVESVLNDLLAQGPDRPLPLWSRPRFMAKLSKRARMASLRRTLDLTTPPPAEEDGDDNTVEDTVEDQMRRRRRALVALLRQLSSDNEEFPSGGVAISFLEKKAKRESKAVYKNEDLTKRRPEGLETPNYEVLFKYPKFEIRRYDPFSVCTVSVAKPRPTDAYKTDATVTDPKKSGARAFGALAGYLFGKNQEQASMAMTTPVLMKGSGDGREMSFVMPSNFWDDESLKKAPKPLEGSGVMIQQNKGGERAVVMFGGYASKAITKQKEQLLLDELAMHDQWEAIPNEPVTLSQYNDPFTPPWRRLNEVSIAVRPRIVDVLINS